MTIRLAALAIAGLAVGSLVNIGIYALAWFSRPISPWQQRHAQAPARVWSDFLPVVGWFGLARETKIHGRGFWIRPLLIEFSCGLIFPALYWWEVSGHLTPSLAGVVPAAATSLQHLFVGHAILFALMLVATFIDFDEKTIPDEITIPGALCGLLLAAAWPDIHLPVPRPLPLLPGFGYQPLLLTSTSEWPAWFNSISGLGIGLAIFTAWCVALIPATATLRRGWWNGVRFYFASICREHGWWKLLILAVLGNVAIAAAWRGGGAGWQGLLSALVGLAFGGGSIWAVRIVGRMALHKEAMGFGDVTLMAMIGAFLGWQACLMTVFLSSILAVVVAVIQAISTGQRDIPFGPYLCAAAAIIMIRWPLFWQQFGPVFGLGWLVPALLVVCLALMAGLLMLWRIVEGALFARRE